MACPAVAPQIQFTLAPRESKAFNDICASAFGAPNTAGGVEFTFTGDEEQLVVTSRLYSTSPLDSVGMFIPGLDGSKAHAATVLTSIRHDPAANPPAGFRTNVGVFNPGSSATTVTFTITDNGAAVGVPVLRSVSGHSGVQVSGIFEAAGAAGLSAQNVEIVVESAVPLFSYAAVLDNRTADPIFVVGAPNLSGSVTPGDTNTPTATPPATDLDEDADADRGRTQPDAHLDPDADGAGPLADAHADGPESHGDEDGRRRLRGRRARPRRRLRPQPAPRTETATRTATPTNLPNQVNIGPGSELLSEHDHDQRGRHGELGLEAGPPLDDFGHVRRRSRAARTGSGTPGPQSPAHVLARHFLTPGTFTVPLHGTWRP